MIKARTDNVGPNQMIPKQLPKKLNLHKFLNHKTKNFFYFLQIPERRSPGMGVTKNPTTRHQIFRDHFMGQFISCFSSEFANSECFWILNNFS